MGMAGSKAPLKTKSANRTTLPFEQTSRVPTTSPPVRPKPKLLDQRRKAMRESIPHEHARILAADLQRRWGKEGN